MTQVKKIALLGTHGVPARHGAFEQAIFKICEVAKLSNVDAHFLVGCSAASRSLHFNQSNVTRIFAARPRGIGILFYDLATSLKAYLMGARTFVYFGYEFAPFFPLLRLLGVRVICNVDGIEWRRAKWQAMARRYFRFCEWMAARTASELVFDAVGIARYYGINHGVSGNLIFYGSDPVPGHSTAPDFEPNSYYSLVMRMEPENNIKMIIEGFGRSNSSRPLLLIGPSTEFFERECTPHIDGVKVRYLGPIYDRERLLEIRRNSYAYVHGHSVGGTNPTLIEAIALGNRVIAYNSIFNREVCGDNARYFSNAEDLALIINEADFPPPPKLSDAYEWDTVAAGYFQLCGLTAASRGSLKANQASL